VAYATLQQLKDRLGTALYARLTDRVAGATANDTVGQQIVDEAQAEADSYLAQRYATPVDLSAHPEVANTLTARVLDIAEYVAWKGSPFVSELPPRVQQLYDAAGEWLRAVARGEFPLPATSPPTSRTAVDDSPRYAAEERVFTRDELDGL
jgi:phage gp36-like protein